MSYLLLRDEITRCVITHTEETLYDLKLADARVLKQLGDISIPGTTFSVRVSILIKFEVEKLKKITRFRWKAWFQSVGDGYEKRKLFASFERQSKLSRLISIANAIAYSKPI